MSHFCFINTGNEEKLVRNIRQGSFHVQPCLVLIRLVPVWTCIVFLALQYEAFFQQELFAIPSTPCCSVLSVNQGIYMLQKFSFQLSSRKNISQDRIECVSYIIWNLGTYKIQYTFKYLTNCQFQWSYYLFMKSEHKDYADHFTILML